MLRVFLNIDFLEKDATEKSASYCPHSWQYFTLFIEWSSYKAACTFYINIVNRCNYLCYTIGIVHGFKVANEKTYVEISEDKV